MGGNSPGESRGWQLGTKDQVLRKELEGSESRLERKIRFLVLPWNPQNSNRLQRVVITRCYHQVENSSLQGPKCR